MSKPKIWLPMFGLYLRRIRKQRGILGKEAAEKICDLTGTCFAPGFLTIYEQGKVRNPDREVLLAMSLVYEIDYTEIISVLVREKYGIIFGAQDQIMELELLQSVPAITEEVIKRVIKSR